MKKRFFIQAGLTTMLFFLFLNLFGSPFSSFTSRSPEKVELDHEWAITPTLKLAFRKTKLVVVMKKYSKHLRRLLNYGVCHPDTSPYYNY